MENNELEVVKQNENAVLDFNATSNSRVKVETRSTIKDSKTLFNLETTGKTMLNDIVGESIRVKDVLIRTFEKPLEQPVIDEETGEIIKESERTVSCILIDESGKQYATGSKTFTFDMMKYLGQYGGASNLKDGVDIKIIKKSVGKNGNKALSFELL